MSTEKWKDWARTTQTALRNLPDDDSYSSGARWFLHNFYRANRPLHLKLPEWPALQWTFDDVEELVGRDTPVEFQNGRIDNEDYELQAPLHRYQGGFGEFAELMRSRPDNDVYITAQNSANNSAAFGPLHAGLTPKPEWIDERAGSGFFWIGGNTMTPLHHDLTNNLVCQIMGTKQVRLVPPDQIDKIQYRAGVHSNLKWLSNERIADHDIEYMDYNLSPGESLFIPIGWWHCIRAVGPSVSVVFTNFRYRNDFFQNFPF